MYIHIDIHINLNICAISIYVCIIVYIYIYIKTAFPWPVGRPWWCRWLRRIRWDQWMSPWKGLRSVVEVFMASKVWRFPQMGGTPKSSELYHLYIYISWNLWWLGDPLSTYVNIFKGLNPQNYDSFTIFYVGIWWFNMDYVVLLMGNHGDLLTDPETNLEKRWTNGFSGAPVCCFTHRHRG